MLEQTELRGFFEEKWSGRVDSNHRPLGPEPRKNRWAEKVYPNLIYFNEAEKGGHFAAWEEPEIFARELRAAFSSLR